MTKYENALRRIGIIFILVNLLSPLSTYHSLAQETLPSQEPPPVLAMPTEEPILQDPVQLDPPEQAPPANAPVQAAPVVVAPEPQQPSQPQPDIVQQPEVSATGGLHIVLLDENGNLLPGGAFTIWDINGVRHDVTDGGAGDLDDAPNGVIVVTDLLAGQVTIYQRDTADWYGFDPNKIILHGDITPVVVYENISDTRVEVRNKPLDSDLDGMADRADNCVAVANGDQLDTDADGSGDACDQTPRGDAPTEIPAPGQLVPADPVETLAVCTDGILSSPTLTLAETEGVVYTIDPVATDESPYAVGQTVIITASLADEDSAWSDTLPEGWSVVEGTTTLTRSVTFTDVECENNASLSLTKTAVAVNDEPIEGEPADLLVGDVVTYEIVVTNDGDADLTGVTVTDELEGVVWDASNGVIGDLAAGDSATIHTTYTITEADRDAGTVTNVATATAIDPDGVEVAAEPASIAVGVAMPVLTLTKEATELKPGAPEATSEAVSADDSPDADDEDAGEVVVERKEVDFTSALAGDIVVFELVATNDGKVTLTNVVITDELEGIGKLVCDREAPVTLLPGESLRCTAEYTLTDGEISAGSLINTANATSDKVEAEPVTITVELAPAMTMTRSIAPMAVSGLDFPPAPNSDPSFADVVISGGGGSYPARGCTSSQNNANNNEGAFYGVLGAPDHPAGQTIPDGRAPSLGWGGALVVGFTNNRLTGNGVEGNTVAGGDLVIVERGSAAEPASIYISGALPGGGRTPWLHVGNLTNGSNAADQYFDIDQILRQNNMVGQEFDQVRIVDNPTNGYDPCGRPSSSQPYRNYAGADIDAIWAKSSAAASMTKTADKSIVTEAGETITYTFTVRNLGYSTMTLGSFHDSMGIAISCNWTTLAPQSEAKCTGTYTVTEKDLNPVVGCSPIVNTASVTMKTQVGSVTSTDSTSVVTICPTTVEISKTVGNNQENVTIDRGNSVEFTIRIKNTGTAPAANVGFSDPLPDLGGIWSFVGTQPEDCGLTVDLLGEKYELNCGGRYLEPGETFTVKVQGTTASNTAQYCGETVTNTATLTGGFQEADSASVTVRDCGQINIEKTTTTPAINPGDDARFTITVSNAGTSTQSDVRFTDTLPQTGASWQVESQSQNNKCSINSGVLTCGGSSSSSKISLSRGASFTVTVKSKTSTTLTCGALDNTASITAPSSNAGRSSSARIDVSCATPAITIVKTANTSGPVKAGDSITYTFVITNTGNVPLSNVVVTDPMTGLTWANGSNPAIGTLQPGEAKAVTLKATKVVTKAEVNAGKADNTATVTGTYGDTTIDDADSVSIPTAFSHTLEVRKTADKGSNLALGETVTYTITATNTGNGTLTGVTVSDTTPGVTMGTCSWPGTAGTLGAGTSVTCTATHKITESDIAAGSFQNTASADSVETPKTESKVTVTTVDPSHGLQLTKSASPTKVTSAPTTVTYTFEVKNTGNQTLTNVGIVDPTLTGAGVVIPSIAELKPGETKSVTAKLTVDQARFDQGGSIVNVATAESGNTVSNADDAIVTITPSHSLGFTKEATKVNGKAVSGEVTNLTEGDVVTYTLVAKNTGTGTLTGVTISDPQLGSLTCTQPATLAPDATLTCTGTHTITASDVLAGTFVNSATADSVETEAVQATATVKTVTADPAMTFVKKADITTYAKVDDVVTYTFTIKNTGNVTLTGLTLVDALPRLSALDCDGAMPTTLAPGGTITCTATYTIDQSDLNNGTVVNSATADSTETESITKSVTVTGEQSASISIEKDATNEPDGGYSAGSTVKYSFTVTNSGNVTLTNVVVTDAKVSDLACTGFDGTLTPGQSVTCTATYKVTQGDVNAGKIDNTATVTASAPGGQVSDDDTESVKTNATPAISLTKVHGQDDKLVAGETVTYTFTATNTGTVTLTNVAITDTTPLAGLTTLSCTINDVDAINGSATLQPREQLICQATYKVSQADVNAGKIQNSARVDATYGEKPVTATAQDTLDGSRSAGLTITKTASKVEGVVAGDKITYTYAVQNTGNVTLTSVTVTDNKIAPDKIVCGDGTTNSIPTLEPGSASVECFATVTITQSMIDGFVPASASATWLLTNTATVLGDAPEGVKDPTATAVETISGDLESSISLQKSASPATGLEAGNVVTYTLIATNDGDTTLSNVTVTDPMFPKLTCTAATLAPGKTLECFATYTVTQDDVDRQQDILNTAEATGTDPHKKDVSDTADATVSVVTAQPKLTLVKSVDPASVSAPQDVTYTFTVTNSGNVSIDGISILDETLDGLDVDVTCPTDAGLAPGTSLDCTATYMVTQDDIDAGEDIVNVAQATGWTTTESPIVSNEDDATLTVVQNPSITLTKTVTKVNGKAATLPVTGLEAGDEVTYQMVATNAGNVTLTDVVISDPMLGKLTCAQPATLAPKGTLTCTGTYSITQEDVNAQENLVNTAKVTTKQTQPVTATQTVSPVLAGPGIALEKSVTQVNGKDVTAPVTGLVKGDVVTYTLVATNSGNVTLTGVSIDDPMLGELDCTQPVTLEPGKTLECSGTYTITQGDVDAQESIVNTATATGTPPKGEDVSATDTADAMVVVAAPSLTIGKSATTVEGETVTAGSVITYTFAVKNTGNVTMDGIVVDDPLTGLVWDAANPGGAVGSLAPQATKTITATYTVRAADVEAGQVTNCATVVSGATKSAASCETVTVAQDPSIELQKTGAYNAPTVNAPYGSISYTFTVKNTGDVTLTNVVVNDPLLGASDIVVGTLAPQATKVVYGTYALTQADLDNGERDNSATATGTPPRGEKVTDSDDDLVTLPQQPGLSIEKSASPDVVSKAGTVVTYTFTVKNTGNVTLHDVAINDAMAGLAWEAGHEQGKIGTLAPNASTTVTATYTVGQVQIDAGEDIDNTATASGIDTQKDEVTSDPDTETVTVDQNPAIVLDKAATQVNGVDVESASVTGLKKGDVVTYTLTARNSGNVTLTNVVISDPMLGELTCDQPTTLAPNGTLTCTGSYTVSQTDINAGDPIVNIASVTATPPQGEKITADAEETVYPVAQRPELALTKVASAVNGEEVSVEDGTYPVAGLQQDDIVTYTLTATNTGNITLDEVAISDPMLGDLSCGEATSLQPGASLECSGTYTVSQSDIDAGEEIVNIATASSTQSEDATARETVGVEDAEPGIALTKTAILVNAEEPEAYPVEHLMLNDEVTFGFVVTNTGNVTLADIQIVDEFPGLSDLVCDPAQPAELAPNATMTCTATYTITQADLDAPTIVNEATVSGTTPDGTPVSDTDDETLTAHYEPRLVLDKRDGRTTYETVGEVVTYTFTVTNTGNITLTNVQVSDPMAGLSKLTCDPVQGATLAPGAKMTCTATYSVTQADLDRGSLTNRATATSKESAPAHDSASSEAVQKPGISISKSADKSDEDEVVEGTVITYTFTVKNTGNVTLDNVVVTDELPGLVWETESAGAIGTLAPNASKVVTATYTVTTGDVERGYVHNLGSVTGDDPAGDEVEHGDDETTEVDQTLSMALVRTCPNVPAGARVGDTISCEVTITNDGTVTLTDIVVPDARTGEFDRPFPTTLTPGQSETRTFTSVITAEDAENGNLNGQVNASGHKDTQTVTAEATVECDFTAVRGLEIEKSATTPEGEEVTEGSVITYTFEVTNTGDVTLHDVVVDDALAGLIWDAAHPGGTVGTLAPGASTTISATYVVTAADVEAGKVHNLAIVTGDAPGEEDPRDEDEIDVPVDQHPAIELDKRVTLVNGSDPEYYPIEHLMLGDVLTYQMTATNTGDVTLTNVTIDDPLEGLSALECDIALPASLAPGEMLTCTATYTVTQEDLDGRSFVNVATATGTAPNGSTISDTDDEEVVGHFEPILTIEKTATTPDGKAAVEGTVITYTFTVTNMGNITVNDVRIIDAMPGLVWSDANPDGFIGTLAVGESATATATYVVTAEDVQAGAIDNTATAAGETTFCLNDSCDITSDPDEVTVAVETPATPVTPQTPAAGPAGPVTALPVTGSGSGSGDAAEATGLWMLAASAAIAMAAMGYRLRRRVDR